MYFIETREVVKQFSGHLALNRVSISVPRGRIFGLLGPNGAGKTTLIRIINRITAPDSGTVLIEGREIRQSDVFRIGYMPEERGLYRKMKVGEQAIYLAQLKGLSYAEARNRLKSWFHKFEIESWWNRKLEELSKGMQQKVQFIITVIHDPELLIFDEPFSGFDPINADLLKQEIIELKNAGKTIIFSTHNMASVEEICDEIALIDQSQVVLSGQVREIRRRYKTNTFTVQIPLDEKPFVAPNVPFEIIEQRNLQDTTELRIRKPQAYSNAELLAAIAREFEILSFTEEFPSMNEVFINTVSGKNSQ
ncbi:MAG: ATP-binding cassette domain-containing protein [Tannerellaceae bacterium]|jgi:ABC-2 type transport system ATP-binding protein|nr:ATP-binding cassette domain-containing protein [Tannerellaceae bacterium]